MSTLTLAPPRYPELGGEPTLDEQISGAWEGLAAQHPATCPMCGGEFTPLYGSHARPVGGRCQHCETVLT